MPADEAFTLTARQVPSGNVQLSWDVADGHYLYADSISINNEAGDSLAVAHAPPDPVVVDDPYFGISDTYPFDVTLEVDPGVAESLALSWQGCAEAGMCYAPQAADLNLSNMTLSGIEVSKADVAAALVDKRDRGQADPESVSLQNTGDPRAQSLSDDQVFAEKLASSSTVLSMLAFFGMGLLLTFTPCVLPMLPIVSSLVVGAGGGVGRGFSLSVAYVLPMALTYAVAGAIAAVAGANLQSALQTPLVISGFAALFVVLALAMFGLFELQLPSVLRQWLDRISGRHKGGTHRGAASLGILSALIVGPCMTAPLAGALLFITETGNVALGALALLALGLGMGVPVIIVGTVGSALLPTPGPWMVRVKACFGFLLLGMAIWFLSRILPVEWLLGLTGTVVIAFALALWQFEGKGNVSRVAVQTFSVVLCIWGALMLVGSLIGASDPWHPLDPLVAGNEEMAGEPLKAGVNSGFIDAYSLSDVRAELGKAASLGKWTVIDVYAEWCASCQRIEDEVLSAPQSIAAMSGYHQVRADITKSTPGTKALMQEYGIMGPPTLLLIAPNGQEFRSGRLVGEFEVEELLTSLKRAMARVSAI